MTPTNRPSHREAMEKIRHWFIQKPIRHNCPLNQGKGVHHEAAVFTEFAPTIALQDHEWIRVYSADDIQKTIGMGLTRYSEVCQQLGQDKARIEKLEKALKFYADKNNWLRDEKGWRHDMIINDLDDETLTDWDGRFSGKKAREALERP